MPTATHKEKVGAKPSPLLVKAGKKGKPNTDTWTITFEGEYGAIEKTQLVKKNYRLKVVMPDKQVLKGARTQFLRHYVPTLMPRIYKKYNNMFTFDIAEATCTNESKKLSNLSMMNRVELEEYIETNELPVQIELYVDSAELKTAIEEAENHKTRDSFEKNQDVLRGRRGDRIGDAREASLYLEESLAASLEVQDEESDF